MGAAETQVEPGIAGFDVLVARVDSEWMERSWEPATGPDRSPQSLTQDRVHDHPRPVWAPIFQSSAGELPCRADNLAGSPERSVERTGYRSVDQKIATGAFRVGSVNLTR